MTPKEKSTPIDAAVIAANRLRKILSPSTIEKMGGGRLATTITTVDLAEARKELDSIIAALEASSTHSTKADVEALKKYPDELRGDTAYPFDPSRRISNKKRYEMVIEGVLQTADRLEADLKLIINSKESSE